MPSFSDLTDLDLQKRLRDLTRESEQLRREASKRGAEVIGSASGAAQDLYAAIADKVSESLPGLRRRGKALERKAQDHPAAIAAVGLVVVGLAVSLLLRKR